MNCIRICQGLVSSEIEYLTFCITDQDCAQVFLKGKPIDSIQGHFKLSDDGKCVQVESEGRVTTICVSPVKDSDLYDAKPKLMTKLPNHTMKTHGKRFFNDVHPPLRGYRFI